MCIAHARAAATHYAHLCALLSVLCTKFLFSAAFVAPWHHHQTLLIFVDRPQHASPIATTTHIAPHDAVAKDRMGEDSTVTAINAKERFLQNLDRKRAGEDVPSSVLDADLSRLTLDVSPDGPPAGTRTTVEDIQSWRGRWRINHAPHIETLGGVLLTKLPSVEYDFQSDDGRMVSHSRYESKIFGSGWFNADGRVTSLESGAQASSTGSSETKEPVVQVFFERFWWDRNGEDRPTGAPPGGETSSGVGGIVDWLVQAAGKAMFFDGLSVFPVRYLDDNLCVFEFKAAGTVVASERID